MKEENKNWLEKKNELIEKNKSWLARCNDEFNKLAACRGYITGDQILAILVGKTTEDILKDDYIHDELLKDHGWVYSEDSKDD